ncbi:MAG: ABC transporter ATP-binding protein, partial [Verrucomicrobia bacterium]|nr:ABC transporter ATP-binding protein [Verrucomicrobiota bacterium]
FTVEAGEIFGLLGRNGAGKTSTLECLVGLREPDGGEIEVCGMNARTKPRGVREKIGVALQTTALQDKITPQEALRLFGSFYQDRVPPPELLERFGLADKADVMFDTLSGGQRQRLALALAFVNRPAVVLLDEPTAGLDPQSRRELHTHIGRMKHEGCAVLLSTHYIEEAEQLCDRIAIIDRGRIVATGAPQDLIARSSATQSVSLVTTPPLEFAALAALPGVTDLEQEGGSANFRSLDAIATLSALPAFLRQQSVELVELRMRKASLEEIFIRLTHPGGESDSS